MKGSLQFNKQPGNCAADHDLGDLRPACFFNIKGGRETYPRPFWRINEKNTRWPNEGHATSGSVSCHKTCGWWWREREVLACSVQSLEQGVLHCLLQDFVITQEGIKWGCLHSLLGLLVGKKSLDKSLNVLKHQAPWRYLKEALDSAAHLKKKVTVQNAIMDELVRNNV